MKLSVFLEQLNFLAKYNPEALDYEVGIYVTTSHDGEQEFFGIDSIEQGTKVEGWFRTYFKESQTNRNSILLNAE